MSMSGEESSEAVGAGNLLGDQAFISSVLSSVTRGFYNQNEREKKQVFVSMFWS